MPRHTLPITWSHGAYRPGGDEGSYFQTVRVRGVRTSSNASLTVEVNGEKRTFKDGEGITFPRNMGGKQVIHGEEIQFVGYGLQIPSANIDDYADADPKGKVIVYLGQRTEDDAAGIESTGHGARQKCRREGSDCGNRSSQSRTRTRARRRASSCSAQCSATC